jgi:hypothetical protein
LQDLTPYVPVDFDFGPETSPAIRWTSFNSDLGLYQGELLNKEQYTRAFFENSSKDRTYNFQKLRYLWKHLLKSCTGIDKEGGNVVSQGDLFHKKEAEQEQEAGNNE